MADTHSTRRRFLSTLILSLGGALLIEKFLHPKVRRKRSVLQVPKKDLPAQGALVYREARVVLLREAGALYAMSLVCTHLGCTVQVTPDEMICPCHGSTFNRLGMVLKGPADRPLPRLEVVESGEFYEVLV
jgi:Rieske Fe-S protein